MFYLESHPSWIRNSYFQRELESLLSDSPWTLESSFPDTNSLIQNHLGTEFRLSHCESVSRKFEFLIRDFFSIQYNSVGYEYTNEKTLKMHELLPFSS